MIDKAGEIANMVKPGGVLKRTYWFKGLDTIRFFLAFIVLLSHLDNTIGLSLKNASFLPSHYAGLILVNLYSGIGAVIAFFIISGFVIHYPNKAGIKDVKKFWAKRWLRIGIPLVVITIIGKSMGSFEKIPIWSLYCELIYYTIYPILWQIKISWRRQFLISFVLAMAMIVGLSFNTEIASLIHQENLNYSGAYWSFGTLLTWIVGLPCWLLGVMLAEKIDGVNKPVHFSRIMLWRVIALSIGFMLNVLKFHFFLSYLISMNFFALYLYKWIEAEIVYYKAHRISAFFEKLGKFSYSIYLCHGILFVVIASALPLNNYTYLLYIGLTILISYVFYLLVEKPSHLLAKRI